MPYDHRRYDFGLRGRAETTGRRGGAGPSAGLVGDRPYGDGRERRSGERSLRVTARYNRDYVAYDHEFGYGARGRDNYPRNPNMFTGDRPDRIGDARYMGRPYTTIGGTRTSRGARPPMGYDRDFDADDRNVYRF